MITLYRAVEDKPVFPSEALRNELIMLEKERDNGGNPGEYMIDAFRRMGKDKYVRLIELRGIIKEQQFFCDNQTQLRANMGYHRFIIAIKVPDEVATAHLVDDAEILAVGEKPVGGAKNYAFIGDEIAQNYTEWQVEIRAI